MLIRQKDAAAVVVVENDAAVFVVLHSILKLSRTRRKTTANKHSLSPNNALVLCLLLPQREKYSRYLDNDHVLLFSLPDLVVVQQGALNRGGALFCFCSRGSAAMVLTRTVVAAVVVCVEEKIGRRVRRAVLIVPYKCVGQ